MHEMQKTESGNHGTDDVRLTSISHHSLFYEPCFTYAGVDYFGPLNVKKGRSVVKRWEAKFTWMNSRGIQLELATSLESDCFINVFRRFVNRTGRSKFMYSDNGTNFVGVELEITEAMENWKQCQIRDEILQRGCQSVFQPPNSCQWGIEKAAFVAFEPP